MAINSHVDTNQKDEYPIIPVGDYSAVIEKSEDTISKSSGKDMIRLTIKTDKGLVWYYLTDDEYLQEKCRRIFQSAGIVGSNITINSSAFRGLRVNIRIKHEMYGNQLTAKIEKFLSPSGNSRPTAPAQDDTPF